MKKEYLILIITFLLTLTGCATNPVTGKSELSLVSEQKEIAIGEEQYAPSRQAQGGDYLADPEINAYVNQVGQRLVAVSDRKLPYEFKVLNNSVPNAWAMPGGKIAINRGLLIHLKSEAELAAVLGHEIVHAAAKHGVRQMSKGMLLQGAIAGTALATEGSGYSGIAQLGASLGAKLISQKYGRDDERESDYYGMLYMSRAGYDPQGAVALQRTFVKLSQGQQQDWLSGMFASHPPSEERVQNNIALLEKLPKGGEMGLERFQAKIAHLKKTEPAYAAYEQGKQTLMEGDVKVAGKLAKDAVRLEPKEGHFYALMGDIEQKNKKLSLANKHYDKAIALNPDFFYYYLQRGKVREQQNRPEQAKADLKRSSQLLPTANASLSLGNLARKSGNLAEAKTYYAKAASGQSDIGQQAYSSLVELDLKDNPAKYLQVKLGRGAQGQILVQVINPTPKKVAGITVLVTFQNKLGQSYKLQRNLSGSVAAANKQRFDLGLSGKLTPFQINSLRAKVIAAHVLP